MSTYFHERLKSDLERLAAADGCVNIPNMLAVWAVDPEWQQTLLQLHSEDRRALLADLGARVFDSDSGRYATQLRSNTNQLDLIWPAHQREELLRRHTEMLFAGVADRVAFGDPLESGQLLERTEFIGREHIDDARSADKGIVLLSVHQSHPAFAFKHPALSDLSFSAVFHDHGNESSPSMLRRGIEDRVEVLPASNGAVRPMLKRLQQNQCVAFYMDFVFADSTGVLSTLFGQIVRISRSAIAIALRTGAGVVPITVARDYPPAADHVTVECFPPIQLDDLNRDRPGQLELAALRFGIAAELLIRRHPAQWTLWNTLEHRWREAREAQHGPDCA